MSINPFKNLIAQNKQQLPSKEKVEISFSKDLDDDKSPFSDSSLDFQNNGDLQMDTVNDG